jgi:ATP-dependent helicase/nuclease subunit A
MTVHRAKGLEFPVVILADITCHETAAEARRFVDPERRLCAQRLAGQAPRELIDHADDELRRDEEEAVRLLYVAATRARDLIVAPVVGDERHEGWIRRLNPALYPAPRDSRTPLERHPAGCPQFQSELAGLRPANAYARAPGVTPGLHRPEAGSHQVVWWDPSLLELDARETMGLRQSRLLEADDRGERSERGIRQYEAWRTRREELIATGSAPAMRIATATELSLASAKQPLPEAANIKIERVPRTADRPHGKRFGSLVHSILAYIPFDAAPDVIKAKAEFFGRALDATPIEIAAAIATVSTALEAPLMRRATAAAIVRREAPLLLKLPASVDSTDSGNATATMVEGVADLAFVEQRDGVPQWIVVDFKTDFDLDRRVAEYQAQLALYLRAIGRATAMPAFGYLLLI